MVEQGLKEKGNKKVKNIKCMEEKKKKERRVSPAENEVLIL